MCVCGGGKTGNPQCSWPAGQVRLGSAERAAVHMKWGVNEEATGVRLCLHMHSHLPICAPTQHIHTQSTHTGVGPTLRILCEDSAISKYPGGFLVFEKGDTHMLYLRFPLEF